MTDRKCRRCHGTRAIGIPGGWVRCPACDKPTPEVKTTAYEFSHGDRPRGIGAWAFAYRRDADLSEIFWINGGYGEAKKAAKAKAKAAGERTVWVMP